MTPTQAQVEAARKLLRNSSCFSDEVCSLLPCKCIEEALTAAAEADMKCGGNHRIEAIKTLTEAALPPTCLGPGDGMCRCRAEWHGKQCKDLTASAGVPEREHIPQKPGQKPGLLPSGNTAAEVWEQKQWPKEFWDEFLRLRSQEEVNAAIERCAQRMETYEGFSEDERRIAAAAIRALD